MGLVQTVAPTVEPVSVTTLKSELRLLDNSEDGLLERRITAAREALEIATGRAFISQTWRYSFDSFPPGGGALPLPRPRLISVSSVKYYDSDGTLQTWSSSNYQTDTDSEPGRLAPVPGVVWPTAQDDRLAAVQVTYTAGYGTAASDVPSAIQQAVLLLACHLYENREATTPVKLSEIPYGILSIVWAYRWGHYPQ